MTIRQALESRLYALDNAFHTVWENTGSAPPVDVTTPYQAVYFMPAEPDDTEMGSRNRREVGLFQVTLKYPSGAGTADADTKAAAVRAQFRRGLTLTAGSVNVNITDTPAIAAGFMDGGYWTVPVTVRWESWVSS